MVVHVRKESETVFTDPSRLDGQECHQKCSDQWKNVDIRFQLFPEIFDDGKNPCAENGVRSCKEIKSNGQDYSEKGAEIFSFYMG